MNYLLHEDPSRIHEHRIGIEAHHRLLRQQGQPITVMIEPGSPDRHQLERATRMRVAWAGGAGGLRLLVIARCRGSLRYGWKTDCLAAGGRVRLDRREPPGEPPMSVAQAPHPAPETRTVTTRRISCDGGEGALGHPRIWLTIPEAGWIDCPYCDARYVLAEGAGADGH